MAGARPEADARSVTSIIAFMCTGPSEGFDPLCNPAHAVVLLVGLLLALSVVSAGIVVAVRRRWRRRGGVTTGAPGRPE